jgi:lysyl-tRNA synthetase, class II
MANQNNNKGGQQQDVNQLLKVRREKLQNLQEAGKDPFQITKYNVTHHSSDVKELYNAHEAEILGDRIFFLLSMILTLLSSFFIFDIYCTHLVY